MPRYIIPCHAMLNPNFDNLWFRSRSLTSVAPNPGCRCDVPSSVSDLASAAAEETSTSRLVPWRRNDRARVLHGKRSWERKTSLAEPRPAEAAKEAAAGQPNDVLVTQHCRRWLVCSSPLKKPVFFINLPSGKETGLSSVTETAEVTGSSDPLAPE